MGLQLALTGTSLVRDDNTPRAASLTASSHHGASFPTSSPIPLFFERLPMLKFCYGVLTVATMAVAIGPASAQQPATPPATAAPDSTQSTAPTGAYSYFVNLKNGDTVTSPFKVVFGLSPNMGVAPSGVEKANVGHHHLLVDKTLSPEEMTQPITVDEQHVHFGKGQTETTVTLPPGKHTLPIFPSSHRSNPRSSPSP
jgi:hypothetical protein